ncbi:protease [Paenibacillus gansuensis]|uniref:Protease n=1 Tax=Paenibacillus gansuensis TaxID=306542 RepID=A0ABW5PHL8_9BACL
MEQVYWSCLLGGALFAVVTVIFGDLISGLFDGLLDFLSVDFLQPMVLAGGITAFGGAGIMLGDYTALPALPVAGMSALIAVGTSAAVLFGYVKPMRNSETSVGYSMSDLVGRTGLVTVAVPVHGVGEVMVQVGAFQTNHIAASADGEALEAGSTAIVLEVRKHLLYVARFDAKYLTKGDGVFGIRV